MARGCEKILSFSSPGGAGLKNTVSWVRQRLDKSVALLVAMIIALFTDILADIQVVFVPFARFCSPTVVAVSV